MERKRKRIYYLWSNKIWRWIFKWKKRNGKEFDKNGNIISQVNNGKGIIKEYNNDFIKFEGEYIDGERKGKVYDDNGKLIFEDEYLNGQKWNGKIYDINGIIIYELKNGTGLLRNMIFMKQ